jgi:2',3'-cyclic-nucleotide 2'-phosphodiesterase (5'-nucleotidase family)
MHRKPGALLLLGLVAALGPTGPATADKRPVTLLYTNDIESVYEPTEAFWNPDIELIGGLPWLATLIDQVREDEQLSFLFDAGDIYTGALSQATEGRLAWDLYSLMGYDAVNLGNHEFEYGWESLHLIGQRARFAVLSANLFHEGSDIELSQAYTILEKDGVRVGVIGLLGVDAFINAINPAHRRGIEVREAAPIIQRYVDELRDEVDLVVVLTHQNRTAPMQTDKEADPEVQRGFDEDYALAGELEGVDVIFGGHSDHGLWNPVQHPETGTWIGLTFGQGKYLGLMRLLLDTESGEVELDEGRLIPVESAKLEPHPEVTARIAAARRAAPHLTQVIGSVGELAFRRYYRESNMGNLLADILKHASGADIAVMNSGSLRADFRPGDVTVEDVLNVYPFIGKFHVVEIKGSGVRELLEYGYALHYGFLQTAGVEAVYDSRKPPGERLLEARVGGEPLDPAQTYTVASSAFLANGGDGYSMLAAGDVIHRSEDRMSKYFLDFFRANGQVLVPAVGRHRDLARVPRALGSQSPHPGEDAYPMLRPAHVPSPSSTVDQ